MINYLKGVIGYIMNIEDIINRREELNRRLAQALATMDRKDTVKQIYQEIKENQERCPHDIQFGLSENEGECIYCGKKRSRR